MNEEKWWEEYMSSTTVDGEDINCFFDKDVEDLVEEATRRGIEQGKREAWEEILSSVEDAKNPFPKEFLSPRGGTHYAFETCRSLIISFIDEKRKRLRFSNPQKEV